MWMFMLGGDGEGYRLVARVGNSVIIVHRPGTQKAEGRGQN